MTPPRSLSLLLLLGVSVTTGRPPLAAFDLNPDSVTVIAPDFTKPDIETIAAGKAEVQSVMRQMTQGVLPASLWAALPEWTHPPTPLKDAFTLSRTHPDSTGGGVLGRAGASPIPSFYLPDVTNVSKYCRSDIEAFYTEILNGREWALRMVDSWGKVGDGLLAGNTWIVGLMDECVTIRVSQELPQAHFQGQYCSMSYSKKAVTGEEEEEEDSRRDRSGTVEPTLRMAVMAGANFINLPMNIYGTCIPSTCTEQEYQDSLQNLLAPQGLELQYLACQTDEPPTLQYSTADIIMLVTFSVLGVFVLAGTTGDIFIRVSKKENLSRGPLKYFLVFSFYTNLGKIFHINVKESSEVISCLHGIRVLTMTWVVLGHGVSSSMSSANKFLYIKAISESPYLYQVLINALLAVDTFFFMSGLLVAYNLTKEFERSRSFNIPVYYIHRFLRLAPPILLTCGFLAVFPPLIFRGPLSPLMEREGGAVDLCRKYWWRDSFFITNWFFATLETESCMLVCWYTAVDFQLYIVAPIMFLPILKWRKPGAAWLGCLLVASAVIPAVITGIYKLPPNQVRDISNDMFLLVTKLVYTKPWCRASPYLVGLCLGYFFRVNKGKKVKLAWWQVTAGWVVAVVTGWMVVFGLVKYNTLSGEVQEYDAASSILYAGLHRLAWGAAVGWMVFACHMGYGGPINSLLAHPYWQPVSRLTYTIFLIAVNVQFLGFSYSVKVSSYFSLVSLVMESAGVLLVSGGAALVLSMLTESPVMGLEKLTYRRSKEVTRPKTSPSAPHEAFLLSSQETPPYHPKTSTPSSREAFIPVSHEASTPVSHEASTPSSHEASTPSSHEASTPTSHEASTPASHEASTPSSHEASTPSSHEASTPASHEASTPASHEASTPASHEASTPASHEASTPASHEASSSASPSISHKASTPTLGDAKEEKRQTQ